jgi:rubrerythrin
MEKLRCKKCNYFFQAIREPPACPNCGERGKLCEEKSAEDLLNDIE